MPRGKKKSHKGGHRQFTSAYDMAMEAEKNRRKQEWKSKKGIESDDDEEGDEDDPKTSTKKVEDDVEFGSEEEDDESGDEDEPDKHKGISHLIDIENPNRVKQKSKKVSDIELNQKPTLSRREREELQKQQSKERYQKLHEAGKTDQARADLARLALIRKQREEASKKREEEKKFQENAKLQAEMKLLEKHKNAS